MFQGLPLCGCLRASIGVFYTPPAALACLLSFPFTLCLAHSCPPLLPSAPHAATHRAHGRRGAHLACPSVGVAAPTGAAGGGKPRMWLGETTGVNDWLLDGTRGTRPTVRHPSNYLLWTGLGAHGSKVSDGLRGSTPRTTLERVRDLGRGEGDGGGHTGFSTVRGWRGATRLC